MNGSMCLLSDDSQPTDSQTTDDESTPIAAYTSTGTGSSTPSTSEDAEYPEEVQEKKRRTATEVKKGPTKKRKVIADYPREKLQRKNLNVVNGKVSKMPCVSMEVSSVKKGKRVIDESALLLWPLYSVKGGKNAEDADDWIVIAKTEQWLLDLVRLADARTKPCKAIQKLLLKELDGLWAHALKHARQAVKKAAAAAKPGDRITGPGTSIESAKLPLRERTTLKAQIAGFNVMVLNCVRPKVLKVDDGAAAFITKYIAKRAAELAPEDARGKFPEAARIPSRLLPQAKIQNIDDDDTPTVRGKVVWDPDHYAWRIIVKSTRNPDPYTDDQGRPLSVSRSLKAEDDEEARREAYYRAIHAWNTLDESKQNRIKVVNRQQFGTSSSSSSSSSL